MVSGVRDRRRPGRADGVVSDLRDIALRSAPALLLVVLGEFVLPRQESVWSATLIRALGELDIEPVAARKAIQRTAERGVITDVRHGRKARWSFTERGARLLRAGGQRVFEFTGQGGDWDGNWLIVNTTVPEAQRNLRYHLRTRLTWSGLGSPAPGIWITPHTARGAEVTEIIDDLGLRDTSLSYIGRFGPVGDEWRAVERAWDLDDLRSHYAEFMEQFRVPQVRDKVAAFRHRIELVQAYRRFPYLDPALPAELTAAPWLGVEAARFFHRKRDGWSPLSEAYWDQLCAETDSG